MSRKAKIVRKTKETNISVEVNLDGNKVYMFTKENFIHLKNKIKDHFALNENLSVPEFKLLANTSRKYAVPLLEYFDKIKITYREGNNRKLVK